MEREAKISLSLTHTHTHTDTHTHTCLQLYNLDFLIMIVTYKICEVFVQCKAKPAKPSDQVRLAG